MRNLKNWFVMMLALLAASCAFGNVPSYAATFRGADGFLYGNICRFGGAWQVVPFQPVGTSCFIPWISAIGVVTTE